MNLHLLFETSKVFRIHSCLTELCICAFSVWIVRSHIISKNTFVQDRDNQVIRVYHAMSFDVVIETNRKAVITITLENYYVVYRCSMNYLKCWSSLLFIWWLLKEPLCLEKNRRTSLLSGGFLGGLLGGGFLGRGFLGRGFLGRGLLGC